MTKQAKNWKKQVETAVFRISFSDIFYCFILRASIFVFKQGGEFHYGIIILFNI